MTKRKRSNNKQSNKLISLNWKKWGMIAGTIISTFILFKLGSDFVNKHIEDVARDVIEQKLIEYPPAENLQKIEARLAGIEGKVNEIDRKVEGVDQFLRGAKIKP